MIGVAASGSAVGKLNICNGMNRDLQKNGNEETEGA